MDFFDTNGKAININSDKIPPDMIGWTEDGEAVPYKNGIAYDHDLSNNTEDNKKSFNPKNKDKGVFIIKGGSLRMRTTY